MVTVEFSLRLLTLALRNHSKFEATGRRHSSHIERHKHSLLAGRVQQAEYLSSEVWRHLTVSMLIIACLVLVLHQSESANITSATVPTTVESSTHHTIHVNHTNSASTIQSSNQTTTLQSTTPGPDALALAHIHASVRVKNLQFTSELEIPITEGYRTISGKISSSVMAWLTAMLPSDLRPLAARVQRLQAGSVLAQLIITVRTSSSSARLVDTDALARLTLSALRPSQTTSNGLEFDTAAAQVTSVVVIDPTPPPATTDNSYEFSRVMFSMRAPNEVFVDEMNNTESQHFQTIQQNLQRGVKEMLLKRYTADKGWTVETRLFHVWNDSEKGLRFRFSVTVSPQWKNTTETVINMGTNYVYFSRLGGYQIDPTSVTYNDLTNYAPDMGVVVMDDQYRRQLEQHKFNGSYVGDFETERPVIRPVARVHKKYFMDVAVPSFVGIMMVLGMLLICTTTDSHREKFYQQL